VKAENKTDISQKPFTRLDPTTALFDKHLSMLWCQGPFSTSPC
jgi:hypothetical protein